jgi:ribulose 1,5-bisphosphate synthetase/thiazole synthase
MPISGQTPSELTVQQKTVDLTDHYSLRAARVVVDMACHEARVVVDMISHEARQVVEKASHEAMVEKASQEAMVEKASHAAMAEKAKADVTDSSQKAAENGEEKSYKPPSSELLVAKGQKNDAQRQLL